MAPTVTFKSIATSNCYFSSSMVITMPAGIVDGDLLVMSIGLSHQFSLSTSPTPSGWTPIDNLDATSGSYPFPQGTFWKVASSEPASYTITGLDSGTIGSAATLAYTGQVAAGNPILDHGAVATSTESTLSPTPVTIGPMQPGDLVIIFYWASSAFSYRSPSPASWNQRANYGGAANYNLLFVIDKLNGTDTPTLLNWGNLDWVVSSVAISTTHGSGNFLAFFS